MKKTSLTFLSCFIFLIVCHAQFLSDWTKNYNTDCKKCSDPWVGEIYYKIWGKCASAVGGQSDNCNVYLYNNASWTSYDNLTNIIRGKYTGSRSSGVVYIFIKPENVNFGLGTAGHIGWGFQLSDGSFFCGATENYAKGDIRTYWVSAGQNNDFWSERNNTQREMFDKMKSLGYTAYKSLTVTSPAILKTKLRAEAIKIAGFQGISNNCLDHTYSILENYGIPWYKLPSKQIFSFPNKWFNEFYKDVNGNGTYGKAL